MYIFFHLDLLCFLPGPNSYGTGLSSVEECDIGGSKKLSLTKILHG